MIVRANLGKIILVVVILTCFYRLGNGQELIQAPLALHVSSTVSDGKYTISEIISRAKDNNIKVIIITDRDLMRWEYGIWPLQKIIKKTVEEKSIFRYGISRYLKQIETAQSSNPTVILIPGIESAPFYYWQGSIFKNNLAIHNWHKHILAIGLEDAKDYQNLPLIGNPAGLKTSFQPYLAWPLLLLLAGFFCLTKIKYRYRDLQGRFPGSFDRRWQICGVLLLGIGLLFLMNNWPFYGVIYDQYHGDLGIRPYQNFIDYVRQHDGLTFWAHPEAQNVERVNRIKVETPDYIGDLMEAQDYTGFAIFYEGYSEIGCPQGLWDEILVEYCRGIRKKPVWVVGGLSFDATGNLADYLKDLRNMLLVRKFNKSEALQALKEGKLYVVRGKHSSEFRLDKFSVTNNSTGIEKTMGQEITLGGKPQIEIKGHFLNGQRQPFKIKLIKNGRIIEVFETTAPFDISYQDAERQDDKKIYYRIDAESDGISLVTNPIFVIKNRQLIDKK